MTISKSQRKAVQKYTKNNYDRLNILTPKGKKEEIKQHAKEYGESLNAFVNRAIDETIKKDKKIEQDE